MWIIGISKLLLYSLRILNYKALRKQNAWRWKIKRHSFLQEPRGQNKAWIKGGRNEEWYSRLRELFIHQQKEFWRKKAEIREREEKRKRTYAERQAREQRHSEKLRNGTLEERERERVFQQEKKEKWRICHWYHGKTTVGIWVRYYTTGLWKYLLSFYLNSQLCWRERSSER